jgi:hypothetical protein
MFVSDERILDVSVGVARQQLLSLVHRGWLSQASQAAYEGGIDYLLRVGPFGDVLGASRQVRVQFVEPVYRDQAMTLGMRWEATGVTGGLFPVLDASIVLSGEQEERTRAVLTAAYRPPFGPLGAGLDRLVLHRVATGTVRTFLARVAVALQDSPEAAVSIWEPGPEPASG